MQARAALDSAEWRRVLDSPRPAFALRLPSPARATGNSMRLLVFLASLLLCSGAIAQEYLLQPASTCSAVGAGLNFNCTPARDEYVIYIYRANGQWILKHVWNNPPADTKWELELVKDDQEILTLNQPVLFSGTRLLHLIKRKQEYFMSEVAHASFGSEVTITHGKFVRSPR